MVFFNLNHKCNGRLVKYNFANEIIVEHRRERRLDANAITLKDRILIALNEWQSKTIICFKKIDDTCKPQKKSIIFFQLITNGRAKAIQMGQNKIIHLRNTAKIHGIMHEIGHALGLLHEHQRPEREEFVKIIEHEELQRTIAYNSHRIPMGRYDCHSIMHYKKNLWLRPKRHGCKPIGRLDWDDSFEQTVSILTPDDIFGIDYFYTYYNDC